MNLKTLIKKNDFEKVWKCFILKYPEECFLKENYKKLYNILKNKIKPTINKNNLEIHIIKNPDFISKETFLEVVVKVNNENKYFSLQGLKFKEYLSFEVVINKKYIKNEKDFLAHCLYNFNFKSFDNKKITERRKGFKEKILNENLKDITLNEKEVFDD